MTDRHPCFILVPLLLWLVLIPAGCTTIRVPAAESQVSRAEGEALLASWLEQGEARQALQGLAKVKVKTGQGSLSGTQVVIAARPDRLRAETLSPFGTPLLSLAIDGKQLTVLFPGDNLYYVGAATEENLTRFTGMPLAPAMLVDVLLWQPPLVTYEELSTFRTEQGGWRLLLVSGALRQELIFDAAARLHQVRYTSGETLQLAVDYDGFTEDAALPQKIRLAQPPFALQASLDFSELTINPSLPAGRFSLVPPPGSRVIPLDRTGPVDPLPEPPGTAEADK